MVRHVTPVLVLVCVVLSLHAEERIDHDTDRKIRQEATTDSHILRPRTS